MSSLDLVITHDTEDVYTPAEAGMDGIIKDLADIYSAEGVPANFMLIARRAALLKQRGREDVIAAVKRHSVGVHTLSHDQPVAAVQAAGLDWAEGLEVCRRAEKEAFRTVAEAFDCQPVCISSHHVYEATQNYVVARELGVPYVYGWQVAPPLFSVSRICGALNFPFERPQVSPSDSFPPYFEGFDDALSNDPEFEALLEIFPRHVEGCISARQPLMLIHPCHPVKTYTLDWIDHYLSPNGVNLTPAERLKRPGPGIRTPGQMALALRNFRRLVQFIRRHPHLNVLSLPEATAKYGRFPAEIGRLDLLAASQRILALNEVVIEAQYTPAEVLLGFAEALLSLAHTGALPVSLPRRDVLGPLEDPLMIPEAWGELAWQAVIGLAADLKEAADTTGHLPANLPLSTGDRVGLGSLYRALAESYLIACRDGHPPEAVALRRFDRYPKIGPAIAKQFLQIGESPLVTPNLNIDRPYRIAKLQTWALAPAWQA